MTLPLATSTRLLLPVILLTCLPSANAQTYLRLSTISPGTENVQLVYNGDFQSQGPGVAGNHSFPVGWTRQADIFADPGTNMAPVHQGVVARASVAAAAPVAMYRRTVSLEPNTGYVLSAYLWNLGDSINHVRANVDLNDAPQEAQLTLAHSQADADKGYFAYKSFNTGATGSNLTLRVFYDGFAGTGAAAAGFPFAAQWDNIAITKTADFLPPQTAAAGGNLRPNVRIHSPADGEYVALGTAPASLEISAAALDYDGFVAEVAFYDGTNRLGHALSTPFSLTWSNPAPGSHCLTAAATDNAGAATLSAPVRIVVFRPPEPASLRIASSGANLFLSWPTSATSVSLLSSTSLVSSTLWPAVTNPVAVSGDQNLTAVPNAGARRFFGLGASIDPSTLSRKLMMGYQGWFACAGDGSPVNRWVHWFRNNSPAATNATVDFWPDTSELGPDELFATSMTLPDGSPARLYSAFTQKTVVRHFKWMKDHELDGVFLQRFSSELSSSSFSALRNQVTSNVRLGAETYGRVFAIMYDISGQSAATLVSTLTNDWTFLVNTMRLTTSPSYIRHNGKPVVAIWGFGFTDRPGTPEDALRVINYFKAAGTTVMGGVPTYWRTLKNDSQTNAAWATVYRSFDILSPWAVGRYGSTLDADSFKVNLIVPDLAETTRNGTEYMPVVFPGFSWHNLNAGPFNQIPRSGGAFYWRQVYNAVSARCTMIYGAMFDEVDEGTAMFKLAPTPAQLPAQGTFVPLNIDGQSLPSDWYLRLAGQASKMLRGQIPLRAQIPISP